MVVCKVIRVVRWVSDLAAVHLRVLKVADWQPVRVALL